MSGRVYHLAQPGDWARSAETYAPAGFSADGFINCSATTQLTAVARRLYPWRDDLILLTINVRGLEPGDLVYEDLYDLGETFPHLYRPLPASAVLTTGPYLTHLEQGMWQQQTRFDREWMDRMLHPEFTEVGMSGRTYTREETISVSPRDLHTYIPLEDYRLALVDEDVALVRYISHDTSDGLDLRAERTSIWVNSNEGWRLRFHQGTPLP